MPKDSASVRERLARGWRMTWTAVSAVAVEAVVIAVAALPAALFWTWQGGWAVAPEWVRLAGRLLALALAYALFALCLLATSAGAMRLLGWRTPAHAALPIAGLEWPLLRWARYLMSAHVVRLLAGPLFRATPVWTWYHRMNGARLGRRVYINSLTVMDDNLLEFGDGVVIGDGVHLSGHTVEGGVLKTAPVRLGRNVTIGVGSVVGIGVEIEADAQVGALSLVPKYRRLEGGAVYGGVPVRPLDAAVEESV